MLRRASTDYLSYRQEIRASLLATLQAGADSFNVQRSSPPMTMLRKQKQGTSLLSFCIAVKIVYVMICHCDDGVISNCIANTFLGISRHMECNQLLSKLFVRKVEPGPFHFLHSII